MIIKKYIGKTETEAIETAKKELGNSIVIMNVKEVKSKGLFSVFRGKCVEITVALEEEQEKYSTFRKETATVRTKENNVKENVGTEESKSIEEKLENLQNLLVTRLKAEEDNDEKQGAVLHNEKEMITGREQDEDDTAMDEKENEYLRFIKLLYNMMVDNEVDERYANQIIEGLDRSYKPGQTYDQLLANVYQRLVLKFGKTMGIAPATEGPKVVLFIGPTGVGKTTTIAKLASMFSLEQKKKVVLLTTDTYRIAAAEQLRTYANILQVPFRVIYTEEELATAVKDFYQSDYIFVDTTGHSHQNEEQNNNIEKLINCLKELAEVQKFLVLSTTTKYKDIIKIVDSYSAITDYELIFTKLDETYTLGNMLNVKLYTGKGIAYVTCGQNVPDDIESFDPQTIVKQLLGGKRQ
ncbi:MAG: flagellar biosynthesis protein FlhF [Lachnospiraceae bacterium]|nr:flagellar biosynthesis protein FlhF [Lachnospiraceae bacterium]